MNTTKNYIISVIVELPMSHERQAYSLELEPSLHEEFKPIRTCGDDTPIDVQMLTGELYEYQGERLREDRKKLADRLAVEISAKLVKAMGNKDTHNGYEKSD